VEKKSIRVGDFLPSRHGFPFGNDFPCGPVVKMRLPGLRELCFGDASAGLCGGMSFAARDFFEAKRQVPDSGEHPAPGSQLFNYFVRRLWDSFHLPGGPFRYYSWMRLPDEVILQRTLREGWPRVRDELDRGRLAALGFNRYRSSNPMNLGHNHQVLAYGYDWEPETGRVRLLIYDCDYSGRDDITLTFHVSGPEVGKGIVNSTGATVRGFFHTTYRPPGFAWLSYLFGLHNQLTSNSGLL
jgi:hypothetical protein